MVSGEYTVKLEEFQGPLDLLLHLIRRAELDPTEISISTITDQYLTHLERAQRIDVDVGSEFLVMAATLMEIKSRSLMPPEDRARAEREARDEGDPRANLIRQLLSYRKFRDAAEELGDRREAFQKRWPAARIGVDKDALKAVIEESAEQDLEDLDVLDLVESFVRIAAAVNFERLGEHHVLFDDTPIELHAADLLDRLERQAKTTGSKKLTTRELFEGASRLQIVGLFLAMLELTRQRKIEVQQDPESGIITLNAREPKDAEDVDALDRSAAAGARDDGVLTPEAVDNA
ncbi:MAG: segregation/condensation protein A [Phycisphaerales bacterium]|nr:segregation/condensation protein A [Phycisphaerales bacterium]MCB9836659.1 segregation/condensation protein A [Phycisphaera sp.]